MLKDGVHIPEDPNRFVFDDEVAAIFPDMARRAIPLYERMHEMHSRFVFKYYHKCAKMIKRTEPFRILDIGVSHGEFLCRLRLGFDRMTDMKLAVGMAATEYSDAMIAKAERNFAGTIPVFEWGLGLEDPPDDIAAVQFDVIACHHVLQFVPEGCKNTAFYQIGQLLKPGGMFLYADKSVCDDPFIDSLVDDEYKDWRVSNGYTREEIEAKTKALKGTMFPVPTDHTDYYAKNAGFKHIYDTAKMWDFRIAIMVKE